MANGLPATRDEEAPFGLAVEEATTVPEAPVSLVEPDLGAIGLPDAPVELIDSGSPDIGIPEAPVTLLAAPDETALAPAPVAESTTAEAIPASTLLEPEELEFAPVPVSGRAELARGVAPAFVQAQVAVRDLSAEQDALDTRAGEIQRDLGLTRSVEDRTRLQQEQQDNAVARAQNEQALNVARGVRDRSEVVEAQRLGDAQAQLRQRTALDLRQELLEQDEAQIATEAETQRRQQEAREDADQSRERVQAILERGPQASFRDTALRMVREALNPIAFGRPINLDRAIDDLTQSTRQQWQDELDAAKAAVAIGDGSVEDIARQAKQEKIQLSAIREAHIDRTILELDRQLAETSDEFRSTRGQTLLDDLKRQKAEEQANRDALAADQAKKDALDAAKLAKVRADVALVEAKTLGERQKARVAAARTMGSRRRPKKAPGLIRETVVTVPGTDQVLVEFPNTSRGRAEAKATRDIVGEQQNFLDTMNQGRAFFEDAHKQGLAGSFGLESSRTNEEWSVIRKILAGQLAQIKAGPGKATTGTDEEWAEGFLPKNPKVWSSKDRGLRKLDAAISAFENQSKSILGRTTRLDSATREGVVRRARLRRLSKTQAARRAASNAERTVIDQSLPAQERVQAVGLISENARLSEQEGGPDFLEPAVAAIDNLAGKVKDGAVVEALNSELDKFQRFSRDRVDRLNAASGIVGTRGEFGKVARQRLETERRTQDRIQSAREKLLPTITAEARRTAADLPFSGELLDEAARLAAETVPPESAGE